MAIEDYSFSINYGITEYAKPILCYVKDPQFSFIQNLVNSRIYLNYKKQPYVICNPSDASDFKVEDFEVEPMPQSYYK